MKHWLLLIMAATATVWSGCKSKSPTEPPPSEAEVTEAPAPLEPPPPQVLAGRTRYLLGYYGESATMLQPVVDELRQGEEERASGLAAGWLALALARDVVENAESPAAYAMEVAGRNQSPDLVTVAKMAHGAYLLGLDDIPAAVASFEAATAGLTPPTADTAFAHILLAEALIARAFGGAESSEIKHPQDLVAAKRSYEKAAEIAHDSGDRVILLGRVEEGMAAISKYMGQTEAICGHARAALDHYESAGAADYLKEGPRLLSRDAQCSEAS